MCKINYKRVRFTLVVCIALCVFLIVKYLILQHASNTRQVQRYSGNNNVHSGRTPTGLETSTIKTKIAATKITHSNHIPPTLENCGQVCNTSIKGTESMFFSYIEKKIQCDSLWTNKDIDAPRKIGPAPLMPQHLRKYYTYNFQVPIQLYHGGILNQQYAGGNASTAVWTKDHVNNLSKKCAGGTLRGNYGIATTNAIFHSLQKIHSVRGGEILVVGSENPWIESCILQAGAKHITTIEYGKIQSQHPQISTLTPDQARLRYEEGSLGPFDVIVSFSSVEHSGLGRYGDALNPWGDLQAVARMWCVCKAKGYLVLGVMEGKDAIIWNAHRQYGPVMFAHLVANWHQKWREGLMPQRVYVFQRD